MILDSSFLVDLMAGDDGAVAKLDELVADASPVAVSALTVTEVEVGLDESRSEAFERVIEQVDVIPYGLDEARRAARLQRRLRSEGRQIGVLDATIAATALERNRTVVTRNVAAWMDFA